LWRGELGFEVGDALVVEAVVPPRGLFLTAVGTTAEFSDILAPAGFIEHADHLAIRIDQAEDTLA
jgi:hypothetical protein